MQHERDRRSAARDGLPGLRLSADGAGQDGEGGARSHAAASREARCRRGAGRRAAGGGLYARRRHCRALCARARRVGRGRRVAADRRRRSPTPKRSRILRARSAPRASGQPGGGQRRIEKLAALRDALNAAKDAYWAEQVDIERQVAVAWVAFAEGTKRRRPAPDARGGGCGGRDRQGGDQPGPIAPARELLGEMLLEAGNAKDALTAFEATMKKEPNRFRGAYRRGARGRSARRTSRAPRRTTSRWSTIAKDSDNGSGPSCKRARSCSGELADSRA